MTARLFSGVLACAGAFLVMTPAAALADLWVASTGTDSGYCSQANPCATISRAVSLAIPNDTIYVGPGRFTAHVDVDSSISGLTLQGAGASATTVSGGFNGSGSVFTIESGASATINDLAITGGSTRGGGGGVDNYGTLMMERDDVTGNAATNASAPFSAYGGGVASEDGSTLTIADSSIVSNLASGNGGGVSMVQGTLTRDLIDGNIVSPPNHNGLGGGGVLTVGLTSLTSDTIANNKVLDPAGNPSGPGGGVSSLEGSSLTSDTIVNNTADPGDGGGLVGAPPISSILAANPGGNCAGLFARGAYDVDTDGTCSEGGTTTDIVGVDPQLGPLVDNGGPTLTMAIPTSSPAYDASPQPICSGTDQRGVSYLQRGATRCDIGAFQVEAPSTYVANPSAGSVTAYAPGASGDASPVLALKGPATGLNQPTGVVVDANGNVFVTNAANNSITEYAPEVTGNVAPVATIAGSKTRLNQPQDVALDGNGNLLVANLAGSVTEYASGARGNVAPIADIVGSLTRLSKPRGIVVDPDGDLRVTNGNRAIDTYAAHANGNVAPLSRITAGSANDLTSPQGLNFDGSGDLVVADAGAGRVDTFAANASGAAKPLSTLTGSSPALRTPTGLDLDAFDNVFVTDGANDSISEFSPHRSGAATPSAVISGPDTGLASPAFLSELPPPRVPGLHAATSKRRSRKSLLRDGIRLTLTAWGKKAFRAQPVKIGVLARVRGRTFATAKTLPLRPGKTKLQMVQAKRAPGLLRRHHKTKIKLTITIHGGFGVTRHRLTITSTG